MGLGLGKVVAGAMSSSEAIVLAGLDWNVVQRSLGYKSLKLIETNEGSVETHEFCGVDLLANVREDNQLFLGVVSDGYKVIQNREAFAFMDKLAEDGELAYETTFSLNGSKSVVITAQLPTVDTIADDDNQLRYVFGSGQIRCAASALTPTAWRSRRTVAPSKNFRLPTLARSNRNSPKPASTSPSTDRAAIRRNEHSRRLAV